MKRHALRISLVMLLGVVNVGCSTGSWSSFPMSRGEPVTIEGDAEFQMRFGGILTAPMESQRLKVPGGQAWTLDGVVGGYRKALYPDAIPERLPPASERREGWCYDVQVVSLSPLVAVVLDRISPFCEGTSSYKIDEQNAGWLVYSVDRVMIGSTVANARPLYWLRFDDDAVVPIPFENRGLQVGEHCLIPIAENDDLRFEWQRRQLER